MLLFLVTAYFCVANRQSRVEGVRVQPRPVTSINQPTQRATNVVERAGDTLQWSRRCLQADFHEVMSGLVLCKPPVLWGGTSLSHLPVASGFVWVLIFFSFDTQIHMLISPALIEITLNLH